jgi:hypothetical protein
MAEFEKDVLFFKSAPKRLHNHDERTCKGQDKTVNFARYHRGGVMTHGLAILQAAP